MFTSLLTNTLLCLSLALLIVELKLGLKLELGCIWEVRFALPRRTFAFQIFFFFFPSRNLLTFLPCIVFGSHKLHFSATFSLKMGPAALFTHLKIILLQCFLVFSFQLSIVSKRTLSC